MSFYNLDVFLKDNTEKIIKKEIRYKPSRAAIILSVTVFLKALYLALLVTPLWDIPDETGHMAYVMQVAHGGGLPVLGEAEIPQQIINHVKTSRKDNWIAQHPPLYYVISAIPFLIAEQFTDDPEILFRAPRIISCISLALLVVVLYCTSKLVGLNELSALSLAGAIASIPMVSSLASGVNHDIFLFLVSSLVVFFFTRFVFEKDLRFAYIAAAFLCMTTAIKMTAWVMIIPFFFMILLELRLKSDSDFLRKFATVIFYASIFAICWMVRNFYVYGNPLQVAFAKPLASPLNLSIFDYLEKQPFVDHMLIHFYGLIGLKASGLLQVDGLPRAIFSFAILVVAGILNLFALGMIISRCRNFLTFLDLRLSTNWFSVLTRTPLFYLKTIPLAFSVCIFVLILTFSMKGDFFMNLRLFSIAMIFSLGFSAFGLYSISLDDRKRMFLYGLMSFSFFAIVLLYVLYKSYLIQGRFGGIHGRYLYPALPWLLLSLSIAQSKLNWTRVLSALVFFAIVIAEVDAYINQILPWYGGG